MALVVRGRGERREMQDGIDLPIDAPRAAGILDDAARIARCFSRWLRFRLLPVIMLSTQITSAPSARNRSARWEPRNPAPPVMTTRDGAQLIAR